MKRRSEAPGWPATLSDGALTLRPLALLDASAWVAVRRRNIRWLAPWESTPPGQAVGEPTIAGFVAYAVEQRRLGASGIAMPFAVVWQGDLVGQLTLASITRGAMNGATVGYWIDERVAGRGIMPTAVALAVDHAFTAGGLHRIEVNVRPENARSLRVVDKLGFSNEGIRRGFLYVDGGYRDHVVFSLLREDVAPLGLLTRWKQRTLTTD
jgi:ribosomal-protein-alanine N-acetyltransferase